MKDVYLIIGNGFTIDFMKAVGTSSEIDVSNLFRNGELVPWPGNDKPGFLSYKHCPNLWTLGARPNMSSDESIQLIEDIITCANILNKEKRDVDSIYMKAYKELVTYLKALFIYYDKKVDFSKISLDKWGWATYLNKLYNDKEINKVHLVTFNYDVWLERILTKQNIKFQVAGFEENNEKFIIYKPHGSISFAHKTLKIKDVFSIDYKLDVNDGKIDEFEVIYENLTALNSINALIPPAGDSNRLDFEWAKEIRTKVREAAKKMNNSDQLIICGLSYWHVDRLEIDRILTSISPEINDVYVVNPALPKVFNAIITTLFDNVIFFNNSEPIN